MVKHAVSRATRVATVTGNRVGDAVGDLRAPGVRMEVVMSVLALVLLACGVLGTPQPPICITNLFGLLSLVIGDVALCSARGVDRNRHRRGWGDFVPQRYVAVAAVAAHQLRRRGHHQHADRAAALP
jgi:hypothetical protein